MKYDEARVIAVSDVEFVLWGVQLPNLHDNIDLTVFVNVWPTGDCLPNANRLESDSADSIRYVSDQDDVAG